MRRRGGGVGRLEQEAGEVGGEEVGCRVRGREEAEVEEERDEELLNVKVGLRVKLCLYVFSDKNVGMK